MKNIFLQLFFGLLVSSIPVTGFAQFDDVYFNPDEDEYYATIVEEDDRDYYVEDEYYYDDDEYDYYDDNEFYYSSRIRRFHRPFNSIGFYDPFFYDPFYYGVKVYIARPFVSFGFGNSCSRFL